MRAGEIERVEIGGVSYGLRVPDLYDPARARRVLARQGVRRPDPTEFQVAALKGLAEIAAKAGEVEEGRRQRSLLERWYELLAPIDENDIDEPDPMKRAELLIAAEEERRREQLHLFPEVSAIEATLQRHWPPYAELLADRTYWDDVSRIEIVRLLLRERDGSVLPLDDDGLLTSDAYQRLDRDHRVPLATHCFRLLAPDETQRKN